MLSIPDQVQQLEVAKDITHKHILLAEKIGDKHEDIARLLKRD